MGEIRALWQMEKGSPEWINSKITDANFFIKNKKEVSFDETIQIVKELGKIEAWKKYPEPPNNVYRSYEQMIDAEFEGGFQALNDWCRKVQDDTLWEYVDKIGEQGAPDGNENARKDKNNGSNTTFVLSKDRGSTYKVKRLKRDRPDLADKVINGELSANAAYIEAGFAKKKVTVEPSPEGFAKYIAKHFDDNQIKEMNQLIDSYSTSQKTSS